MNTQKKSSSLLVVNQKDFLKSIALISDRIAHFQIFPTPNNVKSTLDISTPHTRAKLFLSSCFVS